LKSQTLFENILSMPSSSSDSTITTCNKGLYDSNFQRAHLNILEKPDTRLGTPSRSLFGCSKKVRNFMKLATLFTSLRNISKKKNLKISYVVTPLKNSLLSSPGYYSHNDSQVLLLLSETMHIRCRIIETNNKREKKCWRLRKKGRKKEKKYFFLLASFYIFITSHSHFSSLVRFLQFHYHLTVLECNLRIDKINSNFQCPHRQFLTLCTIKRLYTVTVKFHKWISRNIRWMIHPILNYIHNRKNSDMAFHLPISHDCWS